ncbi:hypothetical protein Tco_1393871 [Tanacetum coccineum]
MSKAKATSNSDTSKGQDATNASPESMSSFWMKTVVVSCRGKVYQPEECDAFDSDVDEGPTSPTMFMASLTSEDPIYDEAGPSYDSNNPFEVQDHDAFVIIW